AGAEPGSVAAGRLPVHEAVAAAVLVAAAIALFLLPNPALAQLRVREAQQAQRAKVAAQIDKEAHRVAADVAIPPAQRSQLAQEAALARSLAAAAQAAQSGDPQLAGDLSAAGSALQSGDAAAAAQALQQAAASESAAAGQAQATAAAASAGNALQGMKGQLQP